MCIFRRDRVTASGGEVGRLNAGGGAEVSVLHIRIMLSSIILWTFLKFM